MVVSDGIYRIQNFMFDAYLDHSHPGHMRGGDDFDQAHQKWEVHLQADGSYKFRAGPVGGWLFADGGGDNVPVSVRHDVEKTWEIHSAGDDIFTICLHGTRAVLDLGTSHKGNGASVNLWTSRRDDDQQKWRFIRLGDIPPINPWVKKLKGHVFIRSRHAQSVLEVSDTPGDEEDATLVVSSPKNDGPSQLWELEPGDTGGVCFKNVGAGTYLAGYSISAGQNIQARPFRVEWFPEMVGDYLVIQCKLISTWPVNLGIGDADSRVVFARPHGESKKQHWEFVQFG